MWLGRNSAACRGESISFYHATSHFLGREAMYSEICLPIFRATRRYVPQCTILDAGTICVLKWSKNISLCMHKFRRTAITSLLPVSSINRCWHVYTSNTDYAWESNDWRQISIPARAYYLIIVRTIGYALCRNPYCSWSLLQSPSLTSPSFSTVRWPVHNLAHFCHKTNI
jgi:hypothetical protein